MASLGDALFDSWNEYGARGCDLFELESLELERSVAEFAANCVEVRLDAGGFGSLGLKLSAGGSIASLGFEPKTKFEPPNFGRLGAQESPERQPLDRIMEIPNPTAQTWYQFIMWRSVPCIAVCLPGFASSRSGRIRPSAEGTLEKSSRSVNRSFVLFVRYRFHDPVVDVPKYLITTHIIAGVLTHCHGKTRRMQQDQVFA